MLAGNYPGAQSVPVGLQYDSKRSALPLMPLAAGRQSGGLTPRDHTRRAASFLLNRECDCSQAPGSA